jgi:hypothetical protein
MNSTLHATLRTRRFLEPPTSKMAAKPGNITTAAYHRAPAAGAGKDKTATGAVVLMVTTVDAPVLVSVSVAGLNEQLARLGNPEQEKVIGGVKLPPGVSARVTFADCPARTLTVDADAENRKSGVANTVSATAAEVDVR